MFDPSPGIKIYAFSDFSSLSLTVFYLFPPLFSFHLHKCGLDTEKPIWTEDSGERQKAKSAILTRLFGQQGRMHGHQSLLEGRKAEALQKHYGSTDGQTLL